MHRISFRLAFAGCVLLASIIGLTRAAAFADYICTVKKATGFEYNPKKKEWDVAALPVGGKYRLMPSATGKCWPQYKDDKERCAWNGKIEGEDDVWIACSKEIDEYGHLFCKTLAEGAFKFNRKSLRFLHAEPHGYFAIVPGVGPFTDETSPKELTPLMEIGTGISTSQSPDTVEESEETEGTEAREDSEAGVHESEAGVDESEAGVDETEAGVDETEAGVDETEAEVEE